MTLERMRELAADDYRGMSTLTRRELSDFPPKKSGAIRKVAIFCWSTFGGGAERATMLMTDYLLAKGIAVVWFHTVDIGDIKIDHPNASFQRIPDEPNARLDYCLRALPELDIDTCLFPDHSLLRTMMDILVARSFGCRILVAEHNCFFYPIDDGQPLLHAVREKVYRLADVVTALSPANVAWWQSVGIRQVVYMPNYLTFELADRTPSDVATRRNEFLFVARICDRKGPDLVLRAFAKALESPGLEDARMTFLGRFETPKYEEYLKGVIQKLGLADRVAFEGEVRDVGRYYARAKLLLMGSRMEGAPMVLGEAKAYGLPAVVFGLAYVDGVGEKYGVVPVAYGDTDAMAAAIVGCVNDPDRYARLSAAARTSLDGLQKERITSRWDKILAALGEGREIADPMCEIPDAAAMLPMTMETLSLSVQNLDGLSPQKLEAALQAEREGFKRHFDWHMNKMQEWVDSLSRDRDSGWAARDQLCYELERSRIVNEAIVYSLSYRLGRLLLFPFRLAKRLVSGRRGN